MHNTKQMGTLRFFRYFDTEQNAFVGVCIELGIVKEHTDPEALDKELREAAFGYIEAVGKKGLPDALLNQRPPREYLDRYKEYVRSLALHRRTDEMSLNVQHPHVFSEQVPV